MIGSRLKRRTPPTLADQSYVWTADTPMDLLIEAVQGTFALERIEIVVPPTSGTARVLTTPASQRGMVLYTPPPEVAQDWVDTFEVVARDVCGHTSRPPATITVGAVTPAVPEEDVFANGYGARRRIAIPASALTGSVADMPVLIYETLAGLKNVAEGGRVESLSGWDIRLEDVAGNKLPDDLLTYDSATGELLLWAKAALLSATATTVLFLYYGKAGLAEAEADPETTWSDYLAVWDGRTGADRSGNGRGITMTAVGTGTLLGDAGDYNGSGSFGTRTDASGIPWLLSGRTALTVEAFVKSDLTGVRKGIVSVVPTGGTDAEAAMFLAFVNATWASAPSSLQFQWRDANGSSYVVSAANTQTAAQLYAAATWVSGATPALYINGTKEAVPAASVSNAAPALSAAQSTIHLGMAPGFPTPASTGWNGLVDEVRIAGVALTEARIRATYENTNDRRLFYGLGSEDLATADTIPSVVAVPMRAAAVTGTPVDIDVLAAAVQPSGVGTLTIAILSQGTLGTAAVVANKIRYTPTTAGVDTFTYRLSAAGSGKASDSKVKVTVTAASSGISWDDGPRSELPWWSAGYGENVGATLDELELQRKNPSGGLVRGVDLVGLFSPPGPYSECEAVKMRGILDLKSWTGTEIASKTNAGLNIAWRVFPTSKSGVVLPNPPATWPAQNGSIANGTGILTSHNISPRLPVGYTLTLKNDTTALGGAKKKQQGMDVWRKASQGWFDHIWRWQLQNLKTGYIDYYGLGSRRIVLRPFWEFDAWVGGSTSPGGFGYGILHNISTPSTYCIRTTTDLATLRSANLLLGEENNAETDGGTRQPIHDLQLVQAAMRRWIGIMREEISGSLAHCSTLRHSAAQGPYSTVDVINPLDWDLIGPDYYDLGPKTGLAYNNGTNEQRWTDTYNLAGTPGIIAVGYQTTGLKNWLDYVRNYCIPLNPKVKFGIGEWGVCKIPSAFTNSNPGGDNPVFIEKMYDTFVANTDIMGYECYFNNSEHIIQSGGGGPLPLASAKYKAKWGTLT